MYRLPHPASLFAQPLPKPVFKRMVKKKVINFWEHTFRKESSEVTSLCFFKPHFMSLLHPHPMWKTAGHNPFKVAMATVQARFLSGRYRCGSLTRHWSGSDGSCLMSPLCSGILEDIPHIIRLCPSLNHIRQDLCQFTFRYSSFLPVQLMELIRMKCSPDNPTFVDFVIDCSTDSDIIAALQVLGEDVLHHSYAITRTWAYVLHKERLKLLGLWRPGTY